MNQLSIKIVMAMLQALLIETLQIIIMVMATTQNDTIRFQEILITFARRKSKHVGYYANWISGNINAVSQQGNNNNSSVTQSN
jgi:hypothetical protein